MVTQQCDFEASRPGGLRGLMRWLDVGLGQMSGTVTALDEVTCSGNCKASERGVGRQQKGVTDSVMRQREELSLATVTRCDLTQA